MYGKGLLLLAEILMHFVHVWSCSVCLALELPLRASCTCDLTTAEG